MMQKLEILDSSLRDGAQGNNISYTIEDKLKIISLLDDLCLDFIEIGNPYSNIKDSILTSKLLPTNSSKIVTFGSTRKKGAPAESDENLKALMLSHSETVCIYGKSSPSQAKTILSVSLEENLRMISESVAFLKNGGKTVIFDAEHFFDGFLEDSQYALECIRCALNAGAGRIVLCDTNGGNIPDFIYNAVSCVREAFPEATLGIHCHNDNGLSVANTIAAVKAGATHIQGTLLGTGERCGNAPLSVVIPTLMLKYGYEVIPSSSLKKLTHTSLAIAEITNISIPKNFPYIGRYAFAHKAGTHADGVVKLTSSFEHISPESVGNSRAFLISEVAGRNLILQKLLPYFPKLNKNDKKLTEIMLKIKELESRGLVFEGAEESFLLVAKKILEPYTDSFKLDKYDITMSSIEHIRANISIQVDGNVKDASAYGNGPVNALDLAMRQVLCQFYPVLTNIHLSDYKVRVINTDKATGATVRVLISTTDGEKTWSTIGVSEDIIEASFDALSDSYEYYLQFKK